MRKRSASLLPAVAPREAFALMGLLLAVLLVLHATSVLERLNNSALDLTQRLVRKLSPQPAVDNVVIVGVDAQSERLFSEPFALWHKHLGELLNALALGKPALVAMDVVLPERSYDALMPGLTMDLVRGIVTAKHSGGLVLGMRVDARGTPQPIDDLLLAAAGPGVIGLAYATRDIDRVARRLAPLSNPELPLVAQRAALTLGLPLHAGIIDFAAGHMFDYVPMHDVIAWARSDPKRLAMFTGKAVFVGKVGPDDDPVRQPLSLAAWAPNDDSPPGVVLLAQTVRAAASGRIVPVLAAPLQAALIVLGACVVLVRGFQRVWIVVAVACTALIAACYFAYVGGMFLPPAGALIAIALGAALRASYEALAERRSRLMIEQRFAGYVSRNLLDAIVAGEVDPNHPTKHSELAFLFADLRGFTTLTQSAPAEEVLALLNRYYEAVTPAIHDHDGMIDNFRGDGILAIFGAPRAAPDAALRAVRAAADMFKRLAALNEVLVREGGKPLRMGIGLAAGEGVVGNVGTTIRHGYSAVGDAVNVAARLQSMCKPLGMRLIATAAICEVAGGIFELQPLGLLELAGHDPVPAFGDPERESRTFGLRQKSLGAASSDA